MVEFKDLPRAAQQTIRMIASDKDLPIDVIKKINSLVTKMTQQRIKEGQ